jgi:hypothetical protein
MRKLKKLGQLLTQAGVNTYQRQSKNAMLGETLSK